MMLACWNKNEALAALLREPTKNAGALDLQVTEQTWCGVCGVRGAGREGRRREGDGMWGNGGRRRLDGGGP